MSRYIEREAVMKTARDGYHSDFGKSMADLTSLREVLEDTPTADVVEVVRCKDCKHYHQFTSFCEKNSYFYDDNGLSCSPADSPSWTMFADNDFCSYGERMDGGNEE